jgi:hypothetical protein
MRPGAATYDVTAAGFTSVDDEPTTLTAPTMSIPVTLTV